MSEPVTPPLFVGGPLDGQRLSIWESEHRVVKLDSPACPKDRQEYVYRWFSRENEMRLMRTDRIRCHLCKQREKMEGSNGK